MVVARNCNACMPGAQQRRGGEERVPGWDARAAIQGVSIAHVYGSANACDISQCGALPAPPGLVNRYAHFIIT